MIFRIQRNKKIHISYRMKYHHWSKLIIVGDMMNINIGLYLAIFILKVIENAIGTLRLIVISHGKKGLGAFLQLVIAIVWVLSAGAVIQDIQKDPIKIIAFALGSYVGSYVGCVIEEKVAMGNNLLITITSVENGEKIADRLRNLGYAVTILCGEGMIEERKILMIVVKRKQKDEIVKIIGSLDKDCMIVSERTAPLYGGFHK